MNKVVGIFDVEMLARDVVALGVTSRSIPVILRRLEDLKGAESGSGETEFVMRAIVLLVLESCKIDEMGERDELAKAWGDCLRVVGTGKQAGTMEVVRKGVKKVGKAILGRVMRSAEEIERVRAERRDRRRNAGPSEEYVTEMRLWDGMWELL